MRPLLAPRDFSVRYCLLDGKPEPTGSDLRPLRCRNETNRHLAIPLRHIACREVAESLAICED